MYTTLIVTHRDMDNEVLKILIHTDTHLGYMERDPHRLQDSFASFEEALMNAKDKKCDLVIHAGDMFHENKPSRQTMHNAMNLFRKYCFGEDPVYFNILNKDEEGNTEIFKPNGGTPNFQSPHQAISLPYFAIHGNHDDPSREGTGCDALSALDILASSNMVNYFGKSERVDTIDVRPVLIKKKGVIVAMYGIGAIRDERFNRMWRDGKVSFVRPPDDNDTYFNILVIHQNRDKGRGSKNCVHESMIPDWITLVIWGNEHECVGDFQDSLTGNFRVYQPGSSVATSLAYTESNEFPKKFGVLDITTNKRFRYKLHDYLQLRPFVYDTIVLKDKLNPQDTKVDEKVKDLLNKRIKELIQVARESSASVSDSYPRCDLTHRVNEPTLVLVRLRVESEGFAALNVQRFGQKYVGNVANPSELLLFSRTKKEKSGLAGKKGEPVRGVAAGGAKDSEDEEKEDGNNAAPSIESFVREQMQSNRLFNVLPSARMEDAIENYVVKKHTNAISDSVKDVLKKFQNTLLKDKDVDARSEALREATQKLKAAEDAIAGKPGAKKAFVPAAGAGSDMSESEEEAAPARKRPAAKKAPATKAAATKKRGPTASSPLVAKARPARGGKRKTYVDDDGEDDEGGGGMGDAYDDDDAVEIDSLSSEEKPKKRAPARKAATKKAPAKKRAAAPIELDSDDDESEPTQKSASLDLTAGSTTSSGRSKRARPASMR